MPSAVEESPTVDTPSAYPWATLSAVLLTLVGSVVLVFGEADLTFDKFTDYALAGWAALAVGRGLAAKPDSGALEGFAKTLNEFPWATAMIGLIIVTGAAVLVVGDSALTFDEYFQKSLFAAGVLGVARGIAAYKKDTKMIDVYDDSVVYSEPEYDPEMDKEFSEAEGESELRPTGDTTKFQGDV